MTRAKLLEAVAVALRNSEPQKAKAIARTVGTTRKEVNSCLYGELKSQVHQDEEFRWSLIENVAAEAEQFTQTPSEPIPQAAHPTNLVTA